MRRRHLQLSILVVALLPVPVSAATYIVTNTSDSGPGTLRQAIADAASGDTITFSVTGTITLTSGELVIARDLTIQGGASQLAISGNNASRVFSINTGVTATLENMMIKDGYVGAFECGGGVINNGTLTVTDSIVSGNTATGLGSCGGGIYNSFFGTLTVSNSTISGNSAPFGGGVRNDGTVTVMSTTISGHVFGRGIDNRGTLTVTDSTISGNTGGGIFTDTETDTITTNHGHHDLRERGERLRRL